MLHVPSPHLLAVSCTQTRERYTHQVLSRLAGAQTIVAKDAPVWKIDDREEYAHIRNNPQLTRFGTVIDPWSWYAGVWAQAMRAKGRAMHALGAWGRSSHRFKDFVYGATHPEHLIEIPIPLGVLWEPDDAGGWQGLRASTLGLCSFSYLYHYGSKPSWQVPNTMPDFGVDVLVDGHRIEAVLKDMLATLPGLNLPQAPSFTPEQQATLAASYDADMVKWVAEADRPVCALMGYETPFMAGTKHHTLPVRTMGATRRGPGRVLTHEEKWQVGRARWKRAQALRASAK